MAAVEALHRLAQPVAHGLRRSGNDVAVVDEVLPLHDLRGATRPPVRPAPESPNESCSRCDSQGRRRTLDRRAGSGCRSNPCAGHNRARPARRSRATATPGAKAHAVRIQRLVLSSPSRSNSRRRPSSRRYNRRKTGSCTGNRVGAKVPGFNRAAARNPDWRMRLLERLGPQIDVAQFRVLAVEAEHILLGPRANYQIVRLAYFSRRVAGTSP